MARVLSTSEGTHRGAFGPTEWFLFASIGLIWGSSFLLIAIGLNAFEPGLVTWMRILAGAATLAVLPAGRRRVEREDRARLITLAILWVVLPFTLFPLAQQHVTSAVAGMLNGGLPVLAAIVGSIMLRRPPRGIHVVGIMLGAAGVATIAISAAGGGSSEAIGVAMLLLAITCYAFAVNIAAPLQQRYGSVTVMSWMLIVATVLTAPFGIASMSASSFRAPSLLAILVLGAIGTGVAFSFMGRLVGRVGGTRAAFATYLIPVVAIFLGAVVRDEAIEPVAIAGIVAVIAGAILASRPDAERGDRGTTDAGAVASPLPSSAR